VKHGTVMGMMIFVLILVSSFVNPSGTRAQHGVLLECESNEHYTEIEEYTYYQIKIINTGDLDDTYNLTISSPPVHWQVELSKSSVFVPAGENENVLLKVKTTCECEFGEKLITNVTATSESESTIYDEVQTITTFATVLVHLETDMDYVQLNNGDSYIHEIGVRNGGSAIDTFLFTVSQSPELSPILDTESITLSSRTNGTINLTATASPTASYGYYELNIEAESAHNSDKFDLLTITVIIGNIELKAKNFELSNKDPNEGDTVSVSMEISNSGTVNASNLMITAYSVTKDGQKLEIGSELASIPIGGKITIERDIIYTTDFEALAIEAKIDVENEIWEESFDAEELGFGEDEGDFPYPIIALIVIVILVVIMVLLRMRK
jgi:uncharacterized membrane protein